MSKLKLKDWTFADACGVNGNKKDVIRMLSKDYSPSVDNFLTFEQYFFAENIPDKNPVRCWWRPDAWWLQEDEEKQRIILTCGDVLDNKELKNHFEQNNFTRDGVVSNERTEDGDEHPSGCPDCDQEDCRYKERPNYIEILSQKAVEEYKTGNLSSENRYRDLSVEEYNNLSSLKRYGNSEPKLFKNIKIKF